MGCTKHYAVKLGDTRVLVLQESHGEGKNFIHVHQNETTALQAAQAVIRSEGGSVLTLRHSGERNIVFHLAHQRYEFDPNRIFTDLGIKKTLGEFSQATPEAQREVKKLANKIKSLLPEGKVIAVHNNSSYSLKNYLPGADLERDVKLLHVSPEHYFRNFYLVTQETEFHRLKALNFNSIWQSLHAADDGSLSIFLAHRDYVNVEAGYDQLEEQIKMLKHA